MSDPNASRADARAGFARTLTAEELDQTERLFCLHEKHERGTNGKSESTLANLHYTIRHAFRYLGLAPWEWREQHVDDYLSYRSLVKHVAASSQSQCIHALRSFQNYLLTELSLCNEIEQKFGCRPQWFITQMNAIAYKRKAHERKKIIAPLSAEQCEQLIAEYNFRIEVARQAGLKSYNPLRRDKVMTILVLMTGVRADELAKIKLTDFLPDAAHPNFGAYAILRVIGKGAKERAIRLFNPAIRDILDWYIQHVRPAFLTAHTKNPNLLFLSERGDQLCNRQYRRSLCDAGAAAGLPMKVHPHLLRHTYATQMAPIIGPEALQKQLGHEFLSTTLGTYYHQNPEAVGNEVVLGIEKVTDAFDAMTRDL